MKAEASPLGVHDVFRDVTQWDERAARTWVETLEVRAAASDQVKLQSLLVEASRIGEGDTAIEIGCGTGALLADLAHRVGPSGRVIGIEPQPILAEAARTKLAQQGFSAYAEVRTGLADQLQVEDASVDAFPAQQS